MLAQEVLLCVAAFLLKTYGKSCLSSTSIDIPKRFKKKTKKSQGGWTSLTLEFAATPSEVADWPEVLQDSPWPIQSFPIGDQTA
ncbi:hypothetical protein HPG69_016327 [Diceros bicornis minor]|uniref:Uncharacterized protein n=1 Tax=Diceros bicornis minor TaxID=77932 RepID=A0A7J7F737_DICBM|nr:hypothetical protein HPG69_016327 [Diceros bicornis minor]